MSTSFFKSALETAVQTYQTIASLPDPMSAAAFGIACGELMERLNLNLVAASALLKVELDLRSIGYVTPAQTGTGVAHKPK